ncbi:MAG: formate/nitrite transporter family protein [Candidatus Methanomethylophilaceae archaeon]
MKWFIRAILAGMCIAIGGTVFIQTTVACGTEFKWVGAILFSVGLFAVLTYGFNLYTGKVGYILQNDRTYLVEVLVTIIGNFVGCMIVGYLFQFPMAETMCQAKLDAFLADGGVIDAIAKGVFCGVLMYIAVDNYKSKGSMLGTFICVPVFILAGFEHSIADMFYFSSAMMWNMDSFLFTLAILFGNMIGCCLIPAYRLYVNGEERS